MIKTEHSERCRRIANNIEIIANGDMCVCDECGEWFNLYDMYGEGYTVTESGEELAICPNCGHIHEEHPETVSIYDWAEDVLDVRYTFNSEHDLVGAEFLVAFGGPNIWVDTVRGEVRLTWWNESGSAFLSSEAESVLDELACDLWGC